MRSSGGTNFGLARSVVARTKSTIACFAGPSFHDGSGPPGVAVCAGADAGRERYGQVPEATAMIESRARRFDAAEGSSRLQ